MNNMPFWNVCHIGHICCHWMQYLQKLSRCDWYFAIINKLAVHVVIHMTHISNGREKCILRIASVNVSPNMHWEDINDCKMCHNKHNKHQHVIKK